MSGLHRKQLLAGITVVVLGIVLIIAFAGCLQDDDPVYFVAVDGLVLSKANVVLFINTVTPGLNQTTLTAAVNPSDSTDTVTWGSSNPAVATVNQNGVITAVKAGTAVIGVSLGSGGKTAVCKVTVQDMKGVDPVRVTGVSLDTNNLTIDLAHPLDITRLLTAAVTPLNATNMSVAWSSGNSAVAAVNQNGEVTAVKQGTAVITVTAADGAFTDTCTVTVVMGPSGLVITEDLDPVGTDPVVIVMGDGGKTFTASATAPAGDIITYTWTIPDDTTVGFKGAAGVTTTGDSVTIIGKADGDVIVEVTAATVYGTTNPVSFTIHVIDLTNPPEDITVKTTGGAPVAEDEVISIARGAQQTFEAEANRALRYEWTIETGGEDYIEFQGVSGPVATAASVSIVGKTPSGVGTVTITVKAINDAGEDAMSFKVKVVLTPPSVPVVKDGELVVAANGRVVIEKDAEKTLTVEAAAVAGDVISYTWEITKGDIFAGFKDTAATTTTGSSVIIEGKATGTVTITVIAANDDGSGPALTFNVGVPGVVFSWDYQDYPIPDAAYDKDGDEIHFPLTGAKPANFSSGYGDIEFRSIPSSVTTRENLDRIATGELTGALRMQNGAILVGVSPDIPVPASHLDDGYFTTASRHVPGVFDFSAGKYKFTIAYDYDTITGTTGYTLRLYLNNNVHQSDTPSVLIGGGSRLVEFTAPANLENFTGIYTGPTPGPGAIAGRGVTLSGVARKSVSVTVDMNERYFPNGIGIGGSSSLSTAFFMINSVREITITDIKIEKLE